MLTITQISYSQKIKYKYHLIKLNHKKNYAGEKARNTQLNLKNKKKMDQQKIYIHSLILHSPKSIPAKTVSLG